MHQSIEKIHFLSVRYDEKRCGYFVTGSGFDFFLYFTTGDTLECDSLNCSTEVFGHEVYNSTSISIPLNGCEKYSCDVVETLVARALAAVWTTP